MFGDVVKTTPVGFYNGKTYDVIAACHDRHENNAYPWVGGVNAIWASHNDRGGELESGAQWYDPNVYGLTARWQNASVYFRGDLDRNFLHNDGHVNTLYSLSLIDDRVNPIRYDPAVGYDGFVNDLGVGMLPSVD